MKSGDLGMLLQVMRLGLFRVLTWKSLLGGQMWRGEAFII